MELRDLPAAKAYFGRRAIVNPNAEPPERLTEAPLFTRAISSRPQIAAILFRQLFQFSSQSLRAAEIPVTIKPYRIPARDADRADPCRASGL
jgi:hypothetical protein